MIGAQLAAGWRPGGRGVIAVLGVSLVAAVGNFGTLRDSYHSLSGLSVVVRGGLAGLDIAADRARPDLVLTPENSDFNYFTFLEAGPYLSAAEKFGSPAYSQEELAAAPEQARVAADKVMAAALPIALRAGPSPSARGCVEVGGAGSQTPIVSLPQGGADLSAPAMGRGISCPAAIRRRFLSREPGVLRGQERLSSPRTARAGPGSSRWTLADPVRVCPL